MLLLTAANTVAISATASSDVVTTLLGTMRCRPSSSHAATGHAHAHHGVRFADTNAKARSSSNPLAHDTIEEHQSLASHPAT